jgi:hypothetical protein
VDLHAPTEAQIVAIHEALLESCRDEIAEAYDPRVASGVALIALLHGDPAAQVAFGTRDQVARELALIAREEGPAAFGVERCVAELLAEGPPEEGWMLCVVLALGRARVHRVPAPPRGSPPAVRA